jgi:TrmH family RNA methyltransferase
MQIHVVLKGTLYEQNVGAAARACSNMGASKLYLMGSKVAVGTKAYQAAANGQKFLDELQRFQNWEEIKKFTPSGVWVATTSQDGKSRQLQSIKKVFQELKKIDSVQNLFLVFGPENSGLSNEDCDQCHFSVYIPTYGPVVSLNVSQAVLLGLYTLQEVWDQKETLVSSKQRVKLATNQTLNTAEKNLQEMVKQLGFDLENKSVNAYTVLRKCFLKSTPSEQEAELFGNVAGQITRKIKEYNQQRVKNSNF